MGTSGISGLTSQLSDFLTQLQEKQQEQLAANTDETSTTDAASMLITTVQTDSVTISNQAYAKIKDMMAMNSAVTNTADSSYLDEHMAAASARLSLKNSMNSSLESGMESSMEAVEQAAFWNSPGMRTVGAMKDLGAAFQKLFDDLQENVEQQIAEATARREGTADPNEQGTTAAPTESVSTDTAQAQGANEQVTTTASAEGGSAGTAQTPDGSVAPDGGAQVANVLSSTVAGSVNLDGEAQAAAAVSSISITV